MYRVSDIENDGLIRVLLFFHTESLIVNSPEALSEVLVTKSYVFEKPRFLRNFLASVIGWSLLTAEGEEHKTQRRKMLPAFSYRHIKDLYPVFWEKSREGILAMMPEFDDNGFAEIEISNWITRSTLDIIGLAGLGVDFGAIKDETNPLAKSYALLQPAPEDLILMFARAIIPDFVMDNLPLARVRSLRKASQHLRAVCHDLIHDKKKRIENKEDPGVDILTIALRSGVFSEANLVDQMMTFLSAGHDTTAAALEWSLYLLAKNPAIQDRLRKDIRDKLPSIDNNIPITNADVDGISYLTAVTNEVLRFYSPIAQTLRIANCDTTIQGQFVPRDTIITLSPWATNTDPKFWGADAHEFKPERWLHPDQGGTSVANAASGGATSNYAFMTFLHGPRSCIGGSFAKSELACLLAVWVGRFSFELKDKSLIDERSLKLNPSIVTKPEGGLHMLVRIVDGF